MNRTQLADAMLKGINTPNVTEDTGWYIHVSPPFMNRPAFCEVCAMGAALVGHYDGDFNQAKTAWREATKTLGEYDAFADLLNIDPALAIEVEFKHMNGFSIRQIAAWLKSSEGEVKINV